MPLAITFSANRSMDSVVIRGPVLNNGYPNALVQAIDGRPAILFISETIDGLFGVELRGLIQRPDFHVVTVKTSEANKTLGSVSDLIDRVEELHFPRRGVFVALGGGVLLDLVGVAASSYRRGVPLIKVGTTLLAQVDASIGAKCAVNSYRSKNLIGAFYPPEHTLLESRFLATLQEREIRSGLAEIVKLAIICDSTLFDMLEDFGAELLSPEKRSSDMSCQIIDRSVQSMISQLEPNLFETALEREVDFGHTISPRLEHELNYSITHGEAVAIDILLFCQLSALMGTMSTNEFERIQALFHQLGLVSRHLLLLDETFLSAAMNASIVHRGMRLNLPLPVGIGRSQFLVNPSDVSTAMLAEAGRVLWLNPYEEQTARRTSK